MRDTINDAKQSINIESPEKKNEKTTDTGKNNILEKFE